MARIERALGTESGISAAAGLFDLAQKNGAPVALRDIGMNASDLDRAADIAVSKPYWNPREVDVRARAAVRQLLQDAFEGARPP
jgi:alcohol dehydrogenase class IV